MEPWEVLNWVWNSCHLICYPTLARNHARHSPLAANHAANGKRNTRAASHYKGIARSRSRTGRGHVLRSFFVLLYKPKAGTECKPRVELLNMTLDAWLEQNIRLVSHCDALMRCDLKGLVSGRHAGCGCCARRLRHIKNTENLLPAGAATREISFN